jgi:tryptophan-rich sensory protein
MFFVALPPLHSSFVLELPAFLNYQWQAIFARHQKYHTAVLVGFINCGSLFWLVIQRKTQQFRCSDSI